MKKHSKLSKKVYAVIAASLMVLGTGNTDSVGKIELQDVTGNQEIVTNKIAKPQVMLIPNVSNPSESLMYQHRSHSSHSSHSSHRSHYSHRSGGL